MKVFSQITGEINLQNLGVCFRDECNILLESGLIVYSVSKSFGVTAELYVLLLKASHHCPLLTVGMGKDAIIAHKWNYFIFSTCDFSHSISPLYRQ